MDPRKIGRSIGKGIRGIRNIVGGGVQKTGRSISDKAANIGNKPLGGMDEGSGKLDFAKNIIGLFVGGSIEWLGSLISAGTTQKPPKP